MQVCRIQSAPGARTAFRFLSEEKTLDFSVNLWYDYRIGFRTRSFWVKRIDESERGSFMKRILACGTAALLLLSAAWMQASPLQASAADQPEKAQLEDAVYQQILKYQEGRGDKDGIVTEEELAQMEDLQLELENVTSLDFLGRMPALKALWLSDGSLDDLSALKQTGRAYSASHA